MCCQEFFSCFLKLFLGAGQATCVMELARPWVITLKGLDAVMELIDPVGRTGLQRLVRSAMFGILISYP